MNADSFGYFPEKLNEPRPPEDVSWSLIYESEKTMGRSAIGDDYLYLQEAMAYLATTGQLDVKDISNPLPKEAEATADFLIERKKAGQFRNFWSSFDDQVANVKGGEVLAQANWEPVVKEAQKAGLDYEYANGKEFLLKWMQGCYIPTQVADRGNLEQVNQALNWILGGSYSAGITPLRGYVTARPDLGKEYAAEHNLGDSAIQAIDVAQNKIKYKFATEHYWLNSITDHTQEMQAQMSRVLNA
jgi:spermidine/putrescine-binding protein